MATAVETKSVIRGGKNPLDELCINTIRTLSMDAVQAAKSGHPGTPMGMAPVGYYLWQYVLRYDPADPHWFNRDRFVLSAGHASMLLYSLLYLSEVKAVNEEGKVLDQLAVPLDEIKRFRQWGSRCPGHPEYRLTTGVETTTGPLGQGYANSVGMAIASRWLAARYNRPGFENLIDFNVYALGGDGCQMEGISSEAASLAGHLKLSNLCWMYDSNRISIEGSTELAFTENVGDRFLAYGWNVIKVSDANDVGQFSAAVESFHNTEDRPTLIVINSHIGYGAPTKQDTKEAHGEALGEDEIKGTKRNYGWPEDAKFLVPDGVLDTFRAGIGARGEAARSEWRKKFEAYKKAHPDLADQLERIQRRELPKGWDKELTPFPADAKGMATRVSSGKVLNTVAKSVPWLIGGSADLAPSTKTTLTFEGAGTQKASDPGGRNFHFGVREHAMGGILNGLSVSMIRPYGAGFLIFSDYGRMPIRLAAIMEIPVIYVFTHDSVGVGEDGPTHQPIEQLSNLRAIPGLSLIRPADANEVVEAWRAIMNLRREPAILALSRQDLPTLDRSKYASAAGLHKGAYVLADAPGGKPDVLLIATGSEVALCVESYEKLTAEGVKVRLVSMPSWDLFEKQSPEYRESVLPESVKARVAVEMAATFGWSKYVGMTGAVVGMTHFGASAPLKDLLKNFHFTVETVVDAVKAQLKQRS
jgi:transketolase